MENTLQYINFGDPEPFAGFGFFAAVDGSNAIVWEAGQDAVQLSDCPPIGRKSYPGYTKAEMASMSPAHRLFAAYHAYGREAFNRTETLGPPQEWEDYFRGNVVEDVTPLDATPSAAGAVLPKIGAVLALRQPVNADRGSDRRPLPWRTLRAGESVRVVAHTPDGLVRVAALSDKRAASVGADVLAQA